MLKFKKFIFLGVMMMTQLVVFGQNNTSSPYTRFGYGDLANRSFGAGRAMGGVGIGLRSPKQINPMNPASYSCMDSLTFIFDMGASLQSSKFSDGTNQYKNLNGNLDYVAIQFPIARWLAMSAGLMPYSNVGYSFGESLTTDGLTYTNTYSGSGGLNQAYAGLSIDILKRFAVGANFSFLFGNIEHYQNLYFTESTSYISQRSQLLQVRDLKMDFGLQYTHPLSATENVTLGVTYSPKKSMKAKAYETLSKISSSTSAVIESTVDTLKNVTYELPNSFGVGLSYSKLNHLLVAADFLYEQWGDVKYGTKTGDFQNRYRVAVGAEYEPNNDAKNIFQRTRYRVGVHYGNSYMKANSAADNKSYGYKEYGVSLGLGVPLIDYRSLVNVAFEYVKVKPGHTSMVDEQYFRITLNYTFNERWFFKFKLD